MSTPNLFLKNVTAVTLSPASVRRGVNLRVSGELVSGLGLDLSPEPGDEVMDLHGALVMPGLVVGHHHLYSALARGMPFPSADPPKNFHETLQKIWWRLDRALDPETNYLSALAGALDAARFGVTAMVDHHASPSAVPGSLDEIARGIGEVGLRAILCYEVSDRDGQEVAEAGIQENLRFQRSRARDPLLRGMIGAHASFTIGDATLDALARACADTGAGLHMHLLEDAVDRTMSLELHGADPVTRLARRGLLTDRTLLVHGVHLTPNEIQTLGEAGVFLAHNARSNMNNRVGAAPVASFGDRVVLGTDGIDGDIMAEARAAFFRGREHSSPVDLGLVTRMLTGSNALLESYFGARFGHLVEGAVADLVVLDYDPPTPLEADNLAGHLGFAWGAHLVRSVMVAGSFVYRDRAYTRLDPAEALGRTRAGAAALWRKL
ncbi:MAG: amidohydrolase family protein [Polyangia bacterium]|nr:amidohydrolase family protein [Polyangia bacterium]